MKEITVVFKEPIQLPNGQVQNSINVKGNFRQEVKAGPMGPMFLLLVFKLEDRDTELCIPWHSIGYWSLSHEDIPLIERAN